MNVLFSVGKSDYFIKGHYLNEIITTQWLSSINYGTNFPFVSLWDCGAWSYRKKKIPLLGRHLITAEKALYFYRKFARIHSIVVAPDHMLLEDFDFRREYNRKQAEKFFLICQDFIPMAVVHGLSKEDYKENASYLVSLGYSHLAIGGVAGKAHTQKSFVREVIREVRESFPDVYIHVMGVGALSYLPLYKELNINSFDTAAPIQKAFFGEWFVLEDKLFKKNIKKEVIPECSCKACTTAKLHGGDTRKFGSKLNNICRAGHNIIIYLQSLQR